ncbi:DDE-type integrase/transposase/recombinase [Phycicoccus sp. BSK3Z-2]|uniref:DDE-type integrase/transposase/recombinase n=1 Tax=Phycicoccus avicenniae TaxID=2828860 RepID=A0A941I0Q3_9MICO|nr:DDE-type integrase/transposase/recombinase [Phycicoccus avicenniae]MBR7744352.1 DDE-type integrase/transposase/recombinase [Phycicoccus avicenniae]
MTTYDITARQAVVASLLRLGGGQSPSSAHVNRVAALYGVTQRTIYRWLRDPILREALAPVPVGIRRRGFKITTMHLTVIADEQNARSAWRRLRDAGEVECSYATFMRALDNCDPGLREAAIHGFKGLVNNRLYLKHTPPHRNHTFHLDHTILDVFVWPSHREKSPIRAQVTVVVDGYSGLIHAVPWKTDVNGDMVAAALVEAATERDYYGVKVGGVPEQVVLDNAAAHFGPAMRAGAQNLGWLLSPTHPYSSWQNGKAERAIGLLNQRLANRAPGATDAGTTRKNMRRHIPVTQMDRLDPNTVWSWKAFTLALREVVDDLNRNVPVERLGNQTRLAVYAKDPTERHPIDASIAVQSMLHTAERTYQATKNGIQYDNRQYVSADVQFGRRYLVRYLPTLRDSIHLYTANGQYVGEAFEAGSLPPKARAKFMAARAQQERAATAIEHGVVAARRHFADAVNAQVASTDDDGADEVGPSLTAEINARATQPRPRLPRVPARPTPKTDPATESWLAALDDEDA